MQLNRFQRTWNINISIYQKVKRQREIPRRTWRTFLLDMSKQLIGSYFQYIGVILSHQINVHFMQHQYQLMLHQVYFQYSFFQESLPKQQIKSLMQNKKIQIETGNYYRNSNNNSNDTFDLNLYWIQMTIWLFSLTIMKVIIIVIQIFFDQQIKIIGDFLLEIFANNEFEKLFITIIIYPAFMNAFQIWVQDNFLKKKTSNKNNNKDIKNKEKQKEEDDDKQMLEIQLIQYQQ